MSDDNVTENPAFGQIMLTKVSGQTHLYGSDFVHHDYIAISICKSSLHRSKLSYDSYYSGDEIVRVAMSESQWATFVSSFGVGSGVPCTLERVDGKGVPRLGARNTRKVFEEEGGKSIAKCTERLQSLLNDIESEASSLPKKKRDVLSLKVREAMRAIADEVPFIHKQFAEYMEETVEKAKVETHAYMNNVIHRAGIEAISHASRPLEIAKPDDD